MKDTQDKKKKDFNQGKMLGVSIKSLIRRVCHDDKRALDSPP